MPSRTARVVAFIMRFFTALFCRAFYPLWYQRLWMSKSPRLAPEPKRTRYEPVTVAPEGSRVRIPAEWVIPQGADEDRAMLYLHGGGFVVGSIESHRSTVARIARAAGCMALVIDYRLAPEHPFPAALDDCVAAYEWMLEQGFGPEKLAIVGDSAGGGLTASTLLALRDSGRPLPAAAVMISPATDLAMTGETILTKKQDDPLINVRWGSICVGMYLGDTDPRNPLASPVYGDLAGLPPLLIQVGTREVLLDDSICFAQKARAAGVEVELEEWQGMFHVFHVCAPLVPESRQAIERIGVFCSSHMQQGEMAATAAR